MNFDHHSGSSSSHSSSSHGSQDLLPNVLFDQSTIGCPINLIDRQCTDGIVSCDLDTMWDPPTHPELFPGDFVLDDGPTESAVDSTPPSLQAEDEAMFVADSRPASSTFLSFKEPPAKRRRPSSNKQQQPLTASSSSSSSTLPSNSRKKKRTSSSSKNVRASAGNERLAERLAGNGNQASAESSCTSANVLDKVPSYLTTLSTGSKVVPCNDKPVLVHQAIARSNGANDCLSASATREEAPEAGTCSRLPGYAQEFTNSTLWDSGQAKQRLEEVAEKDCAETAANDEQNSASSIFKRDYPIHGDEEEVQQRRILFIGHLPKEWTDPEKELHNIFKGRGLGPIREISVKTRFHRHLDSYAFVYFLHRRDAYAAYDYLRKATEFRQLNVGFGGRWQYLRGQQYTDLEAESGPVEDLLIEASGAAKKSGSPGVSGAASGGSLGGGGGPSLSSSSNDFGSLLKNYVRMRGGLH
uniref:RRM domain-containing protein n=1 Tax=Macrostomum lignano TaxID=282301 RepID=A0A1I8G8S6_9PLAT